MKKSFFPLLLICVFLLFFCHSEKPKKSALHPSHVVQVEYDSLLQTKSYSIKDSSGSHKFYVYLSNLNNGIIRYRYIGSSHLIQQIKPMSVILEFIFSDSSLHVDFNTLHWGALGNVSTQDYSMSRRLALAAAQSAEWNKISGKPLKGHENLFVQKIANNAVIYSELKGLFNGLGYKIEISGVEKVFIQQAKKLPFWDDISSQVNITDKLPYDCQTWFRIERIRIDEQ